MQAHHRASQDFDRAIMTLSGGALAISLAFIHDVAPHPKRAWAIDAAWTLFALSLLLILFSFLTSQGALLRMINQLDQDVEPHQPGVREKITSVLNWLSACAFLVGVGLFVLFASYNLNHHG